MSTRCPPSPTFDSFQDNKPKKNCFFIKCFIQLRTALTAEGIFTGFHDTDPEPGHHEEPVDGPIARPTFRAHRKTHQLHRGPFLAHPVHAGRRILARVRQGMSERYPSSPWMSSDDAGALRGLRGRFPSSAHLLRTVQFGSGDSLQQDDHEAFRRALVAAARSYHDG